MTSNENIIDAAARAVPAGITAATRLALQMLEGLQGGALAI